MNRAAAIYVAGHTGLIGNVVVKKLKDKGYNNLLLRAHSELDLMDAVAVKDFFTSEKPNYVIDCAAKVGGIQANVTYPAEFLYENLQIQNNLMWSAKGTGVKKFLFVSSAVIYPNECPQPMKEEYFMQGAPDPTKSGYAYAKIAGVKFCEYINDEFGQHFISCVPTNIYGAGDNFNPETSHVIPALIRRMHEAKVTKKPEVIIWGTGNGRREFLYVDDLADAIVWLMENYDQKQFVNVGTGEDISIKELAGLIKKLTGYQGRLVFDSTKPEGTPRRLFDTSRLNDAGWHYKIGFEEGLKRTYKWYMDTIVNEDLRTES
ncbi:MAG: GDP-L-fucose synthase [Candidatus Saccharimonadales bacterium]